MQGGNDLSYVTVLGRALYGREVKELELAGCIPSTIQDQEVMCATAQTTPYILLSLASLPTVKIGLSGEHIANNPSQARMPTIYIIPHRCTWWPAPRHV